MISYAQNFEDVILARIFKGKKEGFYVDIGACHPTYDSVTKYFYELGWTGINIEPEPEMYKLLESDRPRDINLQFAVSSEAGKIKFYLAESPANSTCSPEIVHSYPDFDEKGRLIEIDCWGLNEIWLQHIQDRQVDFLKIDIEGFEHQVLKKADFSLVNPSILLIEATIPQTSIASHGKWEHLLLQEYDFIYFDGLNRFYKRKKSRLKLEQEIVPPNVFDEFIKYSEFKLATDLRNANESAQKERKAFQKALAEASESARKERSAFQKALADAQTAYDSLQRRQELWNNSYLGKLYNFLYPN